ncbi:MAG: hypothetical protein LBD67_02015 [Candidatus Accumulibacter sp.]|jgi:hypothetical protein|nr:hypothetical protein [Accumulibacter sp.]
MCLGEIHANQIIPSNAALVHTGRINAPISSTSWPNCAGASTGQSDKPSNRYLSSLFGLLRLELDAGSFFNPFALPRPEPVEGSLSKGKDWKDGASVPTSTSSARTEIEAVDVFRQNHHERR